MGDIRWDLGRPVDVAGQFQQGYDASRARIQQNDLLAMQREQMGQRQQQQKQQQALQEAEQHRDRIVRGARLFEQFQVRDEASYQQALAAARQGGMDVSDVPATYDPQYVEGVRRLATVFQPPSQQDGFTLGEGQVRYDAQGRRIASGPDPRPRYYPIAPGGTLQLDPAYQGGAQPAPTPPGASASPAAPVVGEVQDGYRFRGGNPADPHSWEPVTQGGAGQPNASGTFPRPGEW